MGAPTPSMMGKEMVVVLSEDQSRVDVRRVRCVNSVFL